MCTAVIRCNITDSNYLADRLVFLVPSRQELRCLDDDETTTTNELTRTLSSPAMGRLLEDDLEQLQSVGIQDGHQLYLHTVSTPTRDMATDMRRTTSSTLRQRVSRSFGTNAPAPEPEVE